MNRTDPAATILAPSPLLLLGAEVSVLIPGDLTDGRIGMIASKSPPGIGAPPHIHSREDETIVALDAGFEVLCDGLWRTLPVGDVAFIPRGALHTFRNIGDAPARIVATFTPAGFECFFALFADGLRPDNVEERLTTAAAIVGTQFFLDPEPGSWPGARAFVPGSTFLPGLSIDEVPS